jgi:type IV secretory pathway VirB2 component (pilin)
MGKVRFTAIETFLDNLKGSVGPIAVPGAVLGLSVGGLAMWLGKQWAQLVISGTVLGAALVFLAPSIVQ